MDNSADLCRRTVEALARRGFEAVFAATPEEAVSRVLREAESAVSVGWGGSETVKDLGLREALGAKPFVEPDANPELFLLSANAVTADGRIVNIDGRGNRVAASISGPKRVIYLIGRNKIVEGGVDEAIARIRREACPPNCRRLGKDTPCARTGVCADCDSPDRICKVVAVFERRPTKTPTLAIVIDADLGY